MSGSFSPLPQSAQSEPGSPLGPAIGLPTPLAVLDSAPPHLDQPSTVGGGGVAEGSRSRGDRPSFEASSVGAPPSDLRGRYLSGPPPPASVLFGNPPPQPQPIQASQPSQAALHTSPFHANGKGNADEYPSSAVFYVSGQPSVPKQHRRGSNKAASSNHRSSPSSPEQPIDGSVYSIRPLFPPESSRIQPVWWTPSGYKESKELPPPATKPPRRGTLPEKAIEKGEGEND